MRTLNISISDIEYNKFGLKNENLSFSELLEIVNKELQKLNLRKSVELAEKYNLSKLSMDEITEEVKTVRKNAKNRN
jgi:predicted CopG family antitoxin